MKKIKIRFQFLLKGAGIMALATFGFLGCNQEELNLKDLENGKLDETIHSSSKIADKINVCHYSEDSNTWVLIDVSTNSWEAHSSHGDVRLDDQDGDGYVPDNECGFGVMGDCDDNDPSINPSIEQMFYYVEDNDGDLWYTLLDSFFGTCPPDGFITFDEVLVLNLGDCNDDNIDVNPGAPEICDDVDNNCNGMLLDRSASTSYDGQTFNSGTGPFGAAGTATGEFVHYDGLGCDPAAGDDLTGKIALIERNGCFFTLLALSAQNAGAIGVIICNRDDYAINMSAGTLDEITIPVINIASSACQTILAGGGTVSFTVVETCVESSARLSDPNGKKIIPKYALDRASGKIIALDTSLK